MSGKAQGNIQVYRKKWNFNIGIVIFGVILIYLVVTVLTYATAKHVTAYEVREGSIFRDTAYTGLVLRQETVVNAEADGYINYFVPEGSKVGRKTNVQYLFGEAGFLILRTGGCGAGAVRLLGGTADDPPADTELQRQLPGQPL